VTQKLKIARFIEKIGIESVFLTVGEAVDAYTNSKLLSSC